jgi:hypothetical protein
MPHAKAPYGDRLQLTIKDFGRTVQIRLPRGCEPETSKDRKTITIKYPDSPARKTS